MPKRSLVHDEWELEDLDWSLGLSGILSGFLYVGSKVSRVHCLSRICSEYDRIWPKFSKDTITMDNVVGR